MSSKKKNPPGENSVSRNAAASADDAGDYMVLNGHRCELIKHPTDFTTLGTGIPVAIDGVSAHRAGPHITRMSAPSAAARDAAMNAQRERAVSHHIYQTKDTAEEVMIDDRIILRLQPENPALLEQIIRDFALQAAGTMGMAHVLRVTAASGANPLKIAARVSTLPGVASCAPQVMMNLQLHENTPGTGVLFPRQWYLNDSLLSSPDVKPGAGIELAEAWQITKGNPDIVVAVIDDGFDLEHPAFANTRIHPATRNFAVLPPNGNPRPGSESYHGTPVASIAVGNGGGATSGVAPGCTLLPVRIGFGPAAAPVDILEVFRYVSRYADVVNCSFGLPPSSVDFLHADFRDALTELTRTGGRRGKGLVMVFSAANDDAPTYLPGSQNVNGVWFVSGRAARQIPAGRTVFSGYPLTAGVTVVSASTSLQRKSGYSSWGPHITVAAPSNNLHYMTSFLPPHHPARQPFEANYRGLGQIAATNRPGHGSEFDPLSDSPTTPDVDEAFYTGSFGGTSGAAPVVTGVVALMLSANPDLTATEVNSILQSTADQELDTTLDLANDPNIQGLSGAFSSGKSLFFGAGKVNARRAVRRAQALREAADGEFPTDRPDSGGLTASPLSAVLKRLSRLESIIGKLSARFAPGATLAAAPAGNEPLVFQDAVRRVRKVLANGLGVSLSEVHRTDSLESKWHMDEQQKRDWTGPLEGELQPRHGTEVDPDDLAAAETVDGFITAVYSGTPVPA